MLTLEVDVPQVQYGCQQLENIPTLVFREERFHRGTDVLINFSIISALALDAGTLQQVWVSVVKVTALRFRVKVPKVTVPL